MYLSDPARFELFTVCSNKKQGSFKTERLALPQTRTDGQTDMVKSIYEYTGYLYQIGN